MCYPLHHVSNVCSSQLPSTSGEDRTLYRPRGSCTGLEGGQQPAAKAKVDGHCGYRSRLSLVPEPKGRNTNKETSPSCPSPEAREQRESNPRPQRGNRFRIGMTSVVTTLKSSGGEEGAGAYRSPSPSVQKTGRDHLAMPERVERDDENDGIRTREATDLIG